MELFESKKTKGIKSHIANLVAIAKSDGNFSIGEKRLIFEIGERNGLSKEKVKKIIKSDKPIKFKIPKNDSARFDQVYDLVEMLMKDGMAHEDEMDVVIDLAEKLGFRKAIVGVLVRKLVIGVKNGVSREDLKKESGDFLNYETSNE
ncbi:MAG TPA: hypothetical protein VIK89_15165 [Cytophagaceae bacterium]